MQPVTERPLFSNIIAQRYAILSAGKRPTRLRIDNASLEALERELRSNCYRDLLVRRRILGLDIEVSPTPNFEVLSQ
jgi:hypothetical protein